MRSRWQLTTRCQLCRGVFTFCDWKCLAIFLNFVFLQTTKESNHILATQFQNTGRWNRFDYYPKNQIRLNKLLLASTVHVFSPVATKLITDKFWEAMETLSIVQHGNSFLFLSEDINTFLQWLITCLMIINDTLPPVIDLVISKT